MMTGKCEEGSRKAKCLNSISSSDIQQNRTLSDGLDAVESNATPKVIQAGNHWLVLDEHGPGTGSSDNSSYYRQRLELLRDKPPGPIVAQRNVESDEICFDPEGFSGEFVYELLGAEELPPEDVNLKMPPMVIEDLCNNGIAVWKNAIDDSLVNKLQAKVRSLPSLSKENHGQDSSIRSDEIAFVKLFDRSDDDLDMYEGRYVNDVDAIEDLKHGFSFMTDVAAIIQNSFKWQLLRPSVGMVSRYCSSGTRYESHLDNERSKLGNLSNYRALTVILYLNDAGWSEKDGGCLSYELPGQKHSKVVVPSGGTLVLFDSQKIRHQVLPTYRDRYAMTQWFVSRELAFDKGPPVGQLLQRSEMLLAPRSSPSRVKTEKRARDWKVECDASLFDPSPSFSLAAFEREDDVEIEAESFD